MNAMMWQRLLLLHMREGGETVMWEMIMISWMGQWCGTATWQPLGLNQMTRLLVVQTRVSIAAQQKTRKLRDHVTGRHNVQTCVWIPPQGENLRPAGHMRPLPLRIVKVRRVDARQVLRAHLFQLERSAWV